MTFTALNLLFPVVLAVHNAEEYAGYDDFVRTYQRRLPGKLTTRRVMRDAAILLTVAVAILSGFTYVYRSAALITVSKMAVLALLLNGAGHCLLSLKQRRLVPGTFSAIALVLPYSALAIATMRSSHGDTCRSLLLDGVIGGLATPVVILASLCVSYGLSRLGGRV